MLAFFLNVITAGLMGFFLMLYLFVKHTSIRNPWRWMAGLVAGITVGILMALIDFLIVTPPANMIVTVVGLFLIIVLLGAIMLATQRNRNIEKE